MLRPRNDWRRNNGRVGGSLGGPRFLTMRRRRRRRPAVAVRWPRSAKSASLSGPAGPPPARATPGPAVPRCTGADAVAPREPPATGQRCRRPQANAAADLGPSRTGIGRASARRGDEDSPNRRGLVDWARVVTNALVRLPTSKTACTIELRSAIQFRRCATAP